MARAEMGDEAISANLAAHGNFFVSRFLRGLLFYGVAWVLGAILLSALHLAFPPADGNGLRGRPCRWWWPSWCRAPSGPSM